MEVKVIYYSNLMNKTKTRFKIKIKAVYKIIIISIVVTN